MSLTRRRLLGTAAAALALPAAALPNAALAQDPLSVIATTGMIGDAAATVGGDAVSASSLMGPGVDPHSYRATRSDIVSVGRAELVLVHGLYLEAQMEAFFEDISRRTPLTRVGEAIPPEMLLAHETYADKYDPHVWMAPGLWQIPIAAVADAIAAARPEAAEGVAARAEAYIAEAQALDAYGAEVMATIPADRRVLVTAHDAFRYFGRAYGMEVQGIQGISTESEAGLARISDLVDLLVERQIGAVFVESSVSDRNIRALIEGAASRGHEVVIGGELYSDAMGAEGTYEGTWLGMIDHNITTIARALGGAAPEGGRLGRLS
ncbi:metal ABC transporter solute-binding protein, Zn/Mn family [Pseudoroseicyclus tamaricis]|uniref:Zinc ABC transporter solute-binding protein n=1 Tax=Pseudoroseicyclus tamaricis TaxID=2705421 RepID=A0A6B2JSA1_9RHOB|nr:zinc ABC transporter substrate-binding protein [Pseudoroseicyclus tamaricis]NDU99458.1 zinc ABC transporter solute-binding protein [Pseudoroseicyclus tamaricis]